MPEGATDGSAGLDLFSAQPCTIQPGQIKLIKTDIVITCPNGTYGRISPRSGLTIKQHIDVRAGVIDADYTGNIMVALHNIGTQQQELPSESKIAQLIIEKITQVEVAETQQLNNTTRGENGFGSTDIPVLKKISDVHTDTPVFQKTSDVQTASSPSIPTSHDNIDSTAPTPIPVPYNDNEPDNPTVRSFTTAGANIFLSCDPFGPTTIISVRVTGAHPTLGFQINDTTTPGRLILLNQGSEVKSVGYYFR